LFVIAGLVPTISLRLAVRHLIEITRTSASEATPVLRTTMPGHDIPVVELVLRPR